MKAMMGIFISLSLFCFALSACGTLNSTTYIPANESFVLGEGKHGSYTAQVQNIGVHPVEVIQTNAQGISTTLGVLAVDATQKYAVNQNTSIQFKNQHPELATIKIKAKGDTKLSMGYEKN